MRVRIGDLLEGPLAGAWPLGEEFVMRVWWASVTEGEPLPIEDHDELRWLDRDSLYAVPWLDHDVPAVRDTLTHLGLRESV